MGLDIRVPLGLMFLITGGLLALFGIVTRGSAIYERSLDINVNLVWGGVMFCFGLVMYGMGRRTRRVAASRVQATEQPLRRPADH